MESAADLAAHIRAHRGQHLWLGPANGGRLSLHYLGDVDVVAQALREHEGPITGVLFSHIDGPDDVVAALVGFVAATVVRVNGSKRARRSYHLRSLWVDGFTVGRLTAAQFGGLTEFGHVRVSFLSSRFTPEAWDAFQTVAGLGSVSSLVLSGEWAASIDAFERALGFVAGATALTRAHVDVPPGLNPGLYWSAVVDKCVARVLTESRSVVDIGVRGLVVTHANVVALVDAIENAQPQFKSCTLDYTVSGLTHDSSGVLIAPASTPSQLFTPALAVAFEHSRALWDGFVIINNVQIDEGLVRRYEALGAGSYDAAVAAEQRAVRRRVIEGREDTDEDLAVAQRMVMFMTRQQ